MQSEETIHLPGGLHTEFTTVCAMIDCYCRAHHGSKQTRCEACQALASYALMRLDRCPYGQNKPACNQCPIHCYKPAYKNAMQTVMRYAGPRMFFSHPWLAIRHVIQLRRHVVKTPPAGQSNWQLRKRQKGH